MNLSQDVLIVLLIFILAQNGTIDLTNNTTILLLMLLILLGRNSSNTTPSCGCSNM